MSLGEVVALGNGDILGVGRRAGSCEDFHCWVGEEMLGDAGMGSYMEYKVFLVKVGVKDSICLVKLKVCVRV